MELITLKNKHKHILIEDVVLYPLKINKDESGVLVETLRKDWQGIYGDERPFAMQYYSITSPSVARDEEVWHYHPTKQEDRFLVPYGDIVVAVADNREESSTKDLLNLFYIQSTSDPYIILIPKRTLHGFMVVSNTNAVLLNFPTQLYDPKEEARISFYDANIQTNDGTSFKWDLVRKMFFPKHAT